MVLISDGRPEGSRQPVMSAIVAPVRAVTSAPVAAPSQLGTAPVANTTFGGQLASVVGLEVSIRLDANGPTGASHAWLPDESDMFLCWQQKTCMSTWPRENVPM